MYKDVIGKNNNIKGGDGVLKDQSFYVLGWPKSSFGVFRKMLWKSPNDLFGQPNTTEGSLVLIQT